MNLIVDIGNTRTKYAVFDEGDWVECGLGLPEVYDLATSYRKNGKAVNLILSSTGTISAVSPTSAATAVLRQAIMSTQSSNAISFFIFPIKNTSLFFIIVTTIFSFIVPLNHEFIISDQEGIEISLRTKITMLICFLDTNLFSN